MPADEPEIPLPSADELTLDEAMRFAIDLHQRGFVDAATQVYQRVLAAQPQHAGAMHFMGMAEHQSGRIARGLELLRRATEIDPSYADAHNNLGNILLQLGRFEEAAASYTQALALRPEELGAISNLATVRKHQGQLEEAQRLFRRVLEIAPDHAESLHNLGNTLTQLGQLEQALDVYQRVLALRPYDASSHRELGSALYAVGRIAEAAEVYRNWCMLEPEDPEAHHMLAACTGQNVPDRTCDEAVRRLFDRFATSFDYVLRDRLAYRAPELIAQAVENALGPAPAVAHLEALDVGCGTGLCGPWLRRYARRLVGVDLSPAMLGCAAERNTYDELLPEELTAHLRAHPLRYDLLVSADVLVYFGDLTQVSHAATHALRPGGHFVFTVERALAEHAPGGFRIHPHGRYSHTESYLRSVLPAAGLSVFSLEHAHLRMEHGKPVDGWVVVATKGAVPLS